MNARLPMRAALFLLAGVMSLALLGLPGSSTAAAAAASLSVSPGAHYIGGQAIKFDGNIGLNGERRITLQSHMNRPGDSWEAITGWSSTTRANGDFAFVYPAPGMFGISYRVVSGRNAATPGVKFEALSQDVTLMVSSGAPVAGEQFTIEADTTPTLRRRPDTIGLEPIPGRGLTLQRRVDGDTWDTIGTTTANQNGLGTFQVTEADPGTVVYRVRMEDYFEGGNRIGWFPSFPTYIDISGPGQPVAAPVNRAARAVEDCVQPVVGDSATSTAAGVNRWSPSLFDFAWVAGESLTSPPYRGTRKKGRWSDFTNGAGRVNKHNGGLMLDSKRENDCGTGDFGTTRATLQGNAQTYGRWEVRLRLKSDEASARDYRTVVELVPERAGDYGCGARNVTIAEMLPHDSTVKFGVNARTKQWSGTKSLGGNANNRSLVFAVEVTKTHMSWFYAGKVIGTVKSRAASSDVPMTLRLSMEGNGDQEMNHTELISDWQRAFTLKVGNQVTSGRGLKRSGYSAPAC